MTASDLDKRQMTDPANTDQIPPASTPKAAPSESPPLRETAPERVIFQPIRRRTDA